MAGNSTTPPAVQLGFALPLRDENAAPRSSGRDECYDSDDGSSSDERNDPELMGHRSPRWSDWDGGKVGGIPSWLNPRDLPRESPLRCRVCCAADDKYEGKNKGAGAGTILRFVAQLYCPADDATDNVSAFHRSLYVFACPTCCSAEGDGDGDDGDGDAATSATASEAKKARRLAGCVRVLRCQLPMHNDFYPPSGGRDDGGDRVAGWTKHTSEHWAKAANDDKLNLCAVSGQRSGGRCPKQGLWFCCQDHQRERLRASKQRPSTDKSNRVGDSDNFVRHLPSVFREYELVVEEEPHEAESRADARPDEDVGGGGGEKSKGAGAGAALFPSGDITDADADLEQGDLNALIGGASLAEAAAGVTDPATIAFYARMAVGGEENDVRDQCLRYCRWPEDQEQDADATAASEGDEDGGGVGPLWISSNDRPPPPRASETTSFPPPCQYCGAARAFEFQILPQMLHHLLRGPDDDVNAADKEKLPREVLTESERAVLLEAQSRIESGADLPEGFREQHEAAVAKAREALLGVSNKGKAADGGPRQQGLDWGTIAVYTCTASCGDGGVVSADNGAYREEVAWMQPPLD